MAVHKCMLSFATV